jgi:hypothetical protein
MPDQGPAHRISPATRSGTLPAATMIDGVVPNQLIAEYGLSFLQARAAAREARGDPSLFYSYLPVWGSSDCDVDIAPASSRSSARSARV